ncbi:ribosomal-protein-alanine N-acetyltransferase [Boudabousia liubingyangii]|uniref:[Ribosomal protein bS18]-alanine N-acetyltransferase n=2 Tax=Boudabousia liubingyangii TaxID=1921764 RepID=A0A1Q5PR53_9ACTO|nr:ribosomal-protein-alanine N-acetyltransferase [Boudabousia liubingyangii]OKL49880.1 ribosomal-protein-alanine N-acetyltransferase [Boudabousia liubingyangii]
MPAGFWIKALDEDDLQDVCRVEQTVFPREAWSEVMLHEELIGPFRVYVGVFDENNQMVGYAGTMHSPETAEIMTIGVIPEARGHGLGKAMTQALINASRILRTDSIFLEVRERNQVAQTLYEEMGFEEISRRPRYYHNPTEDAVIMRLLLDY